MIVLLSGCNLNKKADTTDDNYRAFYEIFTGSFSDSNNDGIGDLQGIINRLDYLGDGNIYSRSSLGIQGIWLTPIFKSPSYHKYDVQDYYTIDPGFGTQEDLDELIEQCHKRNILLILDLVINHTSSQHPWYQEFVKAHQNNDTSNPYYNYYTYDVRFEAPTGRAWCDIYDTSEVYECNFSDDMPELNFNEPAVRQEVLNIARFYLDKGIDGFRFDAAKYIYFNDNEDTLDFWKWYTDQLRQIKEDVYLVGEVWSAENETSTYLPYMNCFNFSMALSDGVIATAARGGNINAYTGYVVSYQDKLKNIAPQAMPISFIANHDTDRAAGYLNVAAKQAYIGASLYLLSPGSPFIYYGEEIGMKGSRGNALTDANRRLGMLWGDGDTIADPEGTDYDPGNQSNGTVAEQLKDKSSLFYHYQKLLRLRKEYPQIARGTYSQLDLGSDDLGGFKVEYNGSVTYIIHNNSDLPLSSSSDLFSKLLDYAGAGTARLSNGTLEVDGYTSVILQ